MTDIDPMFARERRIYAIELLASDLLRALLAQASADNAAGLANPRIGDYATALASLTRGRVSETDLITRARKLALNAADLKPDDADPLALDDLDALAWLHGLDLDALVAAAVNARDAARTQAKYTEATVTPLRAPTPLPAGFLDLADPAVPASVNEWVTRSVQETEIMHRHATDLFRVDHADHAPPGGFTVTNTDPVHGVDDGPTRVVTCGGCGATLTITVTHDLTTTTVTAVERPGG